MPSKIQLTKEQSTVSRKNYKLAREYFGLTWGSGLCLHHKDDQLMYTDVNRYIEWRPEDLVVMTISEHTRLHRKGAHWSDEQKAKRRGPGNPMYGRGEECRNNPNYKGRTPWNKGLTKETDPRVAKYGETRSKNYLLLKGGN